MYRALEREGLFEEMVLEIAVNELSKYKLPDFLTISQKRLQNLDGDALERLNREGYLQLASFISTSLGNIEWLVELKNLRRADAARDG